MVSIERGVLLIAEPFLKDTNFQRSVVLLCEHQQNGTFGITINRETEESLEDYVEDLSGEDFRVYDGGPVSRDHIHFLHLYPESIPGGQHITDGIYWGGDFDQVTQLMKRKQLDKNKIRFYLGYSGWSAQQLDEEMKEKSWLTVPANKELVFHKTPKEIWKDAVKDLGDNFLPIINYPLDPSFN